jgi:hypothetical protein
LQDQPRSCVDSTCFGLAETAAASAFSLTDEQRKRRVVQEAAKGLLAVYDKAA